MSGNGNIDKHDGELLVFIGHADDAKIQADVLHKLQSDVQEKLRGLREVRDSISFTSVKFWKWGKDASHMVGNQQTLIDPYILRAQVAVFVFKDRVGKVTWEELNLCREARSRINVEERFKRLSPETRITVL